MGRWLRYEYSAFPQRSNPQPQKQASKMGEVHKKENRNKILL